jgi:hypothetical protein
MEPTSEIGRELKVSELKVSELRSGSIVIVWKAGRPAAITVWVGNITEHRVFLLAGEISMTLVLIRCGPDLEQVEDDDKVPMKLYEYLGEI